MSTSLYPFLPNFQRAWNITLQPRSGDPVVISSDQIDSPLRVTFSITTRVLLAYWMADIEIWNLNVDATNQLMQLGTQAPWLQQTPLALGDNVIVSAGYKTSDAGPFDQNANKIWQGAVFQPIWTRRDVVDSVVNLRCTVGYLQDALNFVNVSVAAGATTADVVQAMATSAQIPLAPGGVDTQALSQQASSRGQISIGRPYDCFSKIAKDNNMQCWVSPEGLNMRSLEFDPSTADIKITYAPPGLNIPAGLRTRQVKYTIIGTPEQTQDGVQFRVLMDAQVRLGDIIQIAPGTAINRIPLQFGQLPPILDANGIYEVIGLHYTGDTRGQGNDWYTEISGVTAGFFPNFLASSPNVTN